jgi:hypothetical protein
VPVSLYRELPLPDHPQSKDAEATEITSQQKFVLSPSGELTLLVTVLANLRMFDVLPFSQSISEYISNTLFPSCLLVRLVDATSLPSKNVLSVGLLGRLEFKPDLDGRVPA